MSFLKEYDHLKIPMVEILSATNNFDSAKLIGSGGFGRVYKGELSLPEGPIMVAFKRLDRRMGKGDIEFWKEVMTLSRYKHENLISFMCYCIEGDEMILGYEYASRGSLDRYLSDASLTWTHRLKICVGAARGLNYLHDPTGGQQRVLHRDIKSRNILLDENWMAKVSDFGLSKVGPGTLSKESDVYSFGVVLIEILCGRSCYEYSKGKLTNSLVPKWRQCYEENTLDEIIFPGLKEQMNSGSLNAFSAIAYQCVKKARKERPMMAEVLKVLEFAFQQPDIFEDLGKKVDCETLNKIADGAVTPLSCVTQGMSKELDWEVDEIIILKEDYDLSQLPDSLRCKNLLKLSIQVSGFTEIPPTFFEHMPLLEDLDLSTTNIQSLPSCISSLTFLQKLFLRDCSVLMEIPSEIGMLTKLKLLDCEGSDIMYIPKEIGKLNDLEVLRVSLSLHADYFLKTKRVNDSVKIPRNILSKLIKLKELCITTCPEVEWWEEEVKEIQDDLCHLEYLETLKWYLPTKMVLDQFLQIKREGRKIYEDLCNFTLTIGRHPQLTSCLPPDLQKKFENFEKCLKWINAEGNEKEISMIMERAEALFLSRHWKIVRLSDFNLAKLKYCLLAECNEMETLVDVDDLSEDVENIGKVGLESIEYLSIHDMEKFQSIWKGPMGKDSLSKLRILALHTCPKLTTIFTINIAQNLSRLTELTVEDCPNVTSLIRNESPNIATHPLIPCLEKIFLLDLPELESISRGKIILEKVDSLLVYNCLKLQCLSVAELPNIQKIKGEKEWWNDLKCDKSRWQNVFQELQEERNLFEQLDEATNSLQHFHNILSCDAKDEKPLDRSSLGVSQTKGHTSNFPIGKQEGLSLSQPDAKDEKPLEGISALASSRSSKKVNALAATKLHDGYVTYPWQKKMQELLPVPNSSCFLSILFLPKASDKIAYKYNDLEDTLSRANAWHTASQASGVPIVFMNIQTESLLTKITGETACSTVNAGSWSDLMNLANVSLYGFEDYHGADIGVVRAVRLWYAPLGGEIAIDIKIHEGDLKLGFAIGRTEEGFIRVTSVIDDDEDSPATRSGLCSLYREARKARKQLIISRISNQKVLPWMVSTEGAIRCYDTISLSQKLSLHRHAKVPICLHVFVWDQEVAMLGNANLRTQTSPPIAMHVPQATQTTHIGTAYQVVPVESELPDGGSEFRLAREAAGEDSFRFHNFKLPNNWV